VGGYCKSGLVANAAKGGDVAVPIGTSNPFSRTHKGNTGNLVMELYDAYSPQLYKYIRGLGIARAEAEDTVQEVFLRLATHLIDGGDCRNLRAWVFQVAHNLSMDVHREVRRDQTAAGDLGGMVAERSDPDSDPEAIYLQKETMQRVGAALTELTPKQRDGVLMRAQGLRYLEIASVLKVSESRAIYLVKRALMRLAGGL
jgi:RNA polymerase sigma-70 factor, ECF subfamily